MRTDVAAQLRSKLLQLESQLQRVRQRGGDPRVEDQLREEIEKYRQALSYLK